MSVQRPQQGVTITTATDGTRDILVDEHITWHAAETLRDGDHLRVEPGAYVELPGTEEHPTTGTITVDRGRVSTGYQGRLTVNNYNNGAVGPIVDPHTGEISGAASGFTSTSGVTETNIDGVIQRGGTVLTASGSVANSFSTATRRGHGSTTAQSSSSSFSSGYSASSNASAGGWPSHSAGARTQEATGSKKSDTSSEIIILDGFNSDLKLESGLRYVISGGINHIAKLNGAHVRITGGVTTFDNIDKGTIKRDGSGILTTPQDLNGVVSGSGGTWNGHL